MTDKYNATLEEVVPALNVELEKMRSETGADKETFKDIDPEVAFELGYETAIFDVARITGPDPFEVEIRIATIPKEPEDG